jgi:hypothetical protein
MADLRKTYAPVIMLVSVLLACAPTSSVPIASAERIANPIIIRSDGPQPKQVKRKDLIIPDSLGGQPAWVAADVHVSASGNVVRTVLVHGNPVLHEALAEAARAWKFSSFIIEGQARPFVLPLRVDLSWRGARSANIEMSVRHSE